MGNCYIIKTTDSGEILYSCCCKDTSEDKKEMKCGREYIEYYQDNKIEKFLIDFNKHVLIDKSHKSYSVEIEPSRVYFEIMKKHCKY